VPDPGQSALGAKIGGTGHRGFITRGELVGRRAVVWEKVFIILRLGDYEGGQV